jgi:hypothetical protein
MMIRKRKKKNRMRKKKKKRKGKRKRSERFIKCEISSTRRLTYIDLDGCGVVWASANKIHS